MNEMLSLASAFEKFINDVDSVADCLNTSLLDKYLEEARTNLEAYKECIISSHQGVDDKHELTDEELWGVWNNHDGPIPEILRVAIDADRSRFGRLAPNTKYKLIIPDGDPHSAQVWYVQRKGEVVELCISVDSDLPSPSIEKGDVPRDLRESLAKYAHDSWSGWMSYLFGKCERNADGTVTIPKWAVERWDRQVETPYENLPEEEKMSDRAEADKMIEVMKDHVALCQELEELARDAVNGMRYIEDSYGRLYGVGWDRVFDVADRIIPASKREIA